MAQLQQTQPELYQVIAANPQQFLQLLITGDPSASIPGMGGMGGDMGGMGGMGGDIRDEGGA
jgi:hypothetical protein